MRQHVRPARTVSAGHHNVDDVGAVHQLERVDDVFCSGQAAPDMSSADDHDLVNEGLCDVAGPAFGDNAQGQGQRVRELAVAVACLARIEVACVEGTGNVV
ncbi:hypothetical protein D9M72_487660 [compost metagenome]